MRQRMFSFAVVLLLAAQAGVAEGVDIIEEPGEARMLCEYTVECLDEEECTFAQFGHELDLPKTFPGEATMLLGTGDAKGQVGEANGALVLTATDQYGSYMLTQKMDGQARLSVHFVEPLTVVTYHGSCEFIE
ncbi:hypothetical protein [Antarctobacter jejuensis]|uniref:hypothetical protein n=1 Tax=Antarctobacter jejuensis TaxID=1439938 RepID=UPI003FD5E1CE